MDDILLLWTEDLLNGQVRVHARTKTGEEIGVVMGRDLAGTAEMWAMVRLAAARLDTVSTALDSTRHLGGS